jgi:pilus assembly protein CpaD
MIKSYLAPTRTHPAKAAATLLVVSLASALTSCARDPMTTSGIPADYRQRHPIVLSEAQHSLDIPVAMGDHHLPSAVGDNIRGFAQNYTNASSGIIQIQMPQGSANAATANSMRKQIQKTLVGAGVDAGKIVVTSYQADASNDAAPIRLSYIAMTAMTGQCGEWPEDLGNDTVTNRNWHNFGCASQNNLAAQIANPMDLLGPRGVSSVDAERRNTVIESYRYGGGLIN